MLKVFIHHKIAAVIQLNFHKHAAAILSDILHLRAAFYQEIVKAVIFIKRHGD